MKRLREWLHTDSFMIPKLENLREKMKLLAAREMDVLTEIENAEIQPGIRRRQEVVHWLGTIELKRTEVQRIENECKASKSQLNGFIERTVREVEWLIEQGRFPNGLTLFDLKSRAFPFQILPLSGMKFHEHVETIMGWLGDPISCPIGVQGMGGVGKTTLLKQVYNKLLSDPDMEGLVHWVTVSQDFSIYNLQHKVARAIGLDLSDVEDENCREALLHASIMTIGKQKEEGKIRTFVLILDDVWDRFIVHKIGIPLGTNTCKVISNIRPGEEIYCKIVLSTRSAEVCRSMGCRNFYVHVKPLSMVESWRLFVERLQNFKTLLPDVQQIAYLVAMECGCLPLAIITIAVCMRGIFSKEEWQNALDELRNLNGGHHDMENDVLRILKFSYDRLNNELLRWCFLSCVLYPEDCNIERTRLINLWIMEGLLDDVEGRSKQKNKGHAILNKLENYCLLESTFNRQGLKCIKLHDLIRDMGIYITKNHPSIMAKSGFRLSKVPNEKNWKEELVKVILSRNKISEIQPGLSPMTPKLTTLMLNHNPLKGIPESFFVHMKALTLLDLSFTDVVRLPESISELENLRALLLGHCNRLVYVPSVAKLTNLRVLELTDDMKIAAPKGLERLKYLEKLPHFIWKMSDVTDFNAIIQLWQFALLDRYQFRLYDEAYADQFPRLTNYYVKYQIVVNIIGGQFGVKDPSPLLPCNTEVVDIFCMTIKGKRTLTDVLPSLAGLTELIVLTVGDCTGLEYLTVSATKQQDPSINSQLESLEELELSWLPDLRGIVEFGGYSFSRLKELRLKSCPKIKVVFSQNMELHLPNLRLIDVTDCHEVEEIFESNSSTSSWSGEIVGHQDTCGPTFWRFNPILCLPKLEVISLEDLPMLHSLYGGLLVCTSLGYVRTVQCAKLQLVSLSRPRINDTSASTLASFAFSNRLGRSHCIRTTDKLYVNAACSID
ncbi:putative disease resistance protein At1g61300 [Silene latifolia]|uniref:putative disease resistance protein At1g61300 n=1 Tax=Silene latifolia TaxID=37657 RepID=UPI003D76BFA4